MIIFFFILGITIGSFLNVLIDRLPRSEKITGRSYCEICKKTLEWYDLIPILSFVLLRARCRFCKAKLPFQYPLVELLTGVLFVITLGIMNYELRIMDLITLPYALFIISVMIVIFFSDVKYGIIPDKILLPTTLVSILYLLFSTNLSYIISHLSSAIAVFFFFMFIYLITRGRGMGLGDVKFSFLLGLILGPVGSIAALYVAFLTGAMFGLILILWRKKNLKQAIPFGPFLVIGFLVSYYFPTPIDTLFQNFF